LLAAVVLVAQEERHIELWKHEGSEWTQVEARAGETLAVSAVRCTLDVSAMYDVAGAP
jgi:hypothetical protein